PNTTGISSTRNINYDKTTKALTVTKTISPIVKKIGTVPNTTSVSSAFKANNIKISKAPSVTNSFLSTATKTGSAPKLPSALKRYKETSNIYSNKSSDTKNNSTGSRPQSPIPSSVKNNVVQVLQSQRGWIFVDHFCSLYEQKFKINPDFR
ncbi:unnamed protein product, partial [Meganyctiphanes norvegica]